MSIRNEEDLRSGLRALTAAPPAAVRELEARSIVRARHIRVRRAATAVLSVVALAAPAAVVATRTNDPGPARLVPVTSWPDRREPALAEYEKSAFADWARTDALNPGETVRWLYSATIAETEDVIVAFATCDTDRCSRLVMAHGAADSVLRDDGDEEVSSWFDRTYPLDDTRPPAVPAAYLAPDVFDGEVGPGNVVAVLAPPGATRVTWTSPGRLPGTGGSGELTPRGGAFVGDVGYLSEQVTFAVHERHGRALYTGLVGDPAETGLVPNAPWVPEIELPSGFESHSSQRGQAKGSSGHRTEYGIIKNPYTVFVRCAGLAPLVVTADGRRGTAPCDGRVHAVVRDVPVTSDPQDDSRHGEGGEFGEIDERDVEVHHDSADPYTTYTLVIAVRT